MGAVSPVIIAGFGYGRDGIVLAVSHPFTRHLRSKTISSTHGKSAHYIHAAASLFTLMQGSYSWWGGRYLGSM